MACGEQVTLLKMQQLCITVLFVGSVVFGMDVGGRRHTEECQVNFNVWQPDTDMVQRMQILEMKYANFSTYVDVELLHLRLSLQTDLFQLHNISSNLRNDVSSRKLENAKMLSEIAGINRRLGDYENTLEMLDERVNTAVLQKSVRRSVRRKHGRSDRMVALEQPVMVQVLNSKVSDLKAEWILMKRELIELRNTLNTLETEHKDLMKYSTNQTFGNDARRLPSTAENNVVLSRDSSEFTSLRNHVESVTVDVAGILRKQDELDRVVNVVKNDVKALQTSIKGATPNVGEEHIGSSGQIQQRPLSDRISHNTGIPKDCNDIVSRGYRTSGVYQTKPSVDLPLDDVFCEIVGDVGYTVIQRRTDGLQSFNRGWLEYKVGFGNLYGEFWAGNDFIHSISQNNGYVLRVDLWDWEGNRTYAEYDNFSIADEKQKFAITVSGYRGTAGDSMGYHSGMAFSTPDRDNDAHKRNCAADNKGGWWYNSCYVSQLNGIYHVGWYSQPESAFADGVVWLTVKNSERYSLRRAEMKLRRKNP